MNEPLIYVDESELHTKIVLSALIGGLFAFFGDHGVPAACASPVHNPLS
jgi:hypothetical protein